MKLAAIDELIKLSINVGELKGIVGNYHDDNICNDTRDDWLGDILQIERYLKAYQIKEARRDYDSLVDTYIEYMHDECLTISHLTIRLKAMDKDYPR